METDKENKICIMEKTAGAMITDDKKPLLSKDNGTWESTAVKLMISLVVSSSVSMIAFMLKNNRSYTSDVACYFYVAVILVWVALMSLIFFKFMWTGILKNKQQSIKACFAFGMTVNLIVVFSTTIYACATFREETLLFIMLFIGVFNSMVMFMFHDTTLKKGDKNGQSTYFTHNIFDSPKCFQVVVEEEREK